jgi:hypothetical protein
MEPHLDNIREICFKLLDSVLIPNSVAYVAGPLDSGQLFYKLKSQKQSSLSLIRERNQYNLTNFAKQLRTKLTYPVIDPGLLRIPGWTNHDLGKFFLEIVERYAKEVWFLDGWEYSHGATKEFLFCVTKGISCFDQSGTLLTAESGKQLITKAAEYVSQLGLDSSKLRSRLL